MKLLGLMILLFLAKTFISCQELPPLGKSHPTMSVLWRVEDFVIDFTEVKIALEVSSDCKPVVLNNFIPFHFPEEVDFIIGRIKEKCTDQFRSEVYTDMKGICVRIENSFFPKRTILNAGPVTTFLDGSAYLSVIPRHSQGVTPGGSVYSKVAQGKNKFRYDEQNPPFSNLEHFSFVKVAQITQDDLSDLKNLADGNGAGREISHFLRFVHFDSMGLQHLLLTENEDFKYLLEAAVPYNCVFDDHQNKYVFRVLVPKVSAKMVLFTPIPFKVQIRAEFDCTRNIIRQVLEGETYTDMRTTRRLICDGKYSGPSKLLQYRRDFEFVEVPAEQQWHRLLQDLHHLPHHTHESLRELGEVECKELEEGEALPEPACQVHYIEESGRAYIYCPNGEIRYKSNPRSYICPNHVISIASGDFELWRNSVLMHRRTGAGNYSWIEDRMKGIGEIVEIGLQPNFLTALGEFARPYCTGEQHRTQQNINNDSTPSIVVFFQSFVLLGMVNMGFIYLVRAWCR